MRIFPGRKGLLLFFIPMLCALTGLAREPLFRRDPAYFVTDGGVYSCFELWATTGYVHLQLQPGVKVWLLKPVAGALVSFSGSVMVYGGLTWPYAPVKWLVVETGASAGYYESGQGVQLNYPLEFRLSVSALYRFKNQTRLGASFAHISNANLGAPNPGTESISVMLQIPLRK